jgi:membrane-associated phospholipid phosphatase
MLCSAREPPMTGAAILLLLGLLLILAAGAVIALQPQRWIQAGRRWRSRPSVAAVVRQFQTQRDCLVEGLGPVGAFVVLVSAAIPPVTVVCYLLGVLGQHFPLTVLNSRLNAWFLDQEAMTTWLSLPVRAVNTIGNWPETLIISSVAALGLGLAARRRRWLPALLIGTVLLVERCVQRTVNVTLDAQPPPTGAGLFPSGATVRILAVYGLILYLVLRRTRLGWRPAVAGWTAIALVAFLQAYARLYLGYHWAVDVPGGVLLGVLLLVMMIMALSVFNAWPARREARHSPGQPTAADRLTSAREPDPPWRPIDETNGHDRRGDAARTHPRDGTGNPKPKAEPPGGTRG